MGYRSADLIDRFQVAQSGQLRNFGLDRGGIDAPVGAQRRHARDAGGRAAEIGVPRCAWRCGESEIARRSEFNSQSLANHLTIIPSKFNVEF